MPAGILEYCSPTWSPVYKKDIIKLESVQRRFAKKLRSFSSLTYAERLVKLDVDTLELRRLKQDLLTMYKVFNNLLVLNVSEFFEFNRINTRVHNFKVTVTLELSSYVVVLIVGIVYLHILLILNLCQYLRNNSII